MPNLIAFDTETFLIEPGLLTPPGVCGSFATATEQWLELFDPSVISLEGCLKPGTTIAGAWIAYDFGVVCAARPDLIPAIFEKYDRGEVFDVAIAHALHDVAIGMLNKDPANGGPQRAPGVDGKPGKVSRYGLDAMTWILLGRANAKANDEYRKRYRELHGLPLEQWPENAIQYPKDDARNTYDCAAELIKRGGFAHQNIKGRAWTHQTHQARAGWAMHLASIWGLRTDSVAVEALIEKVEGERKVAIEKFTATGLIKPDGKDNGPEIKRRVVAAYSGVPLAQLPKCGECAGTCKVTTRVISEKTGKELKPKVTNCKRCGTTGVVIPDSVPRTEGFGIGTGRDVLDESGDEMLEEFAEAGTYDKIRETYAPWLREGVHRPINVRSNVVLETGRASFEGLIQTMPRKGGVRECFVPRPGFYYCSVDYNAQEFVTLGWLAKEILGYSKIVDALNAGKDPHVMLASNMRGMDYETLKALVKAKDPAAVGLRQAAKPGNFGFGGLMGAAKFVFTQRKAKPFKDAQGNEHGSMCRVVGIEASSGVRCGTVKISEWKRRPCPPVCLACTEFSEELRNGWYTTWEEMKPYHKWVSQLDGIQEGHAVLESVGTGWVRGELNAMAAANHGFQHIAAMMSKHAAYQSSRECYAVPSSPLYGSRLVLFAHDELIAEVPISQAHEAGWRLSQIMLEAGALFCPGVKMGAEPALMERLYKAAEKVEDANGRLQPWRPKVAA